MTICFRFFLMLCCWALAPASTHAREHIERYFRTLDIRSGLSHNTVTSILQDCQGFMWLGTKDGLNRFDGNNFRVFKKESTSLGNNFITALLEDRKGHIYVGTDAGVYIYDPVKELFTLLDTKSKQGPLIRNAVTHIVEGENGDIWISVDYQGLFRYRPEQKELTLHMDRRQSEHAPLPNVSHFWFTDETCWAGLFDDNLYYTTDDFKSLIPYQNAKDEEPFKNETITSQVEGSYNRRYVGSSKGVTEIDLTTGQTRRILQGYIRTLALNSENELWIGTETGLYIYHTGNKILEEVKASSSGDPYGLSDNVIYALCQDHEGGMWIGSYFGGVSFHPYPYTYFDKYYANRRDGFGQRIREFCESDDGSIWIGTEDQGLFNYNPTTDEIKPFRHAEVFHNIHGLCLDGDYLWVGTFTGGLNRINLKTNQVKNYRKGETDNALNADEVFVIYKTEAEFLWIGTLHGLLRYNRDTDDFTSVPELANINITDILEDSQGNLWVTTYAQGVFRLDIRTTKWKHFIHEEKNHRSLPYNKVIGAFEDDNRGLWFLTQGGGICLYDEETASFKTFDMSDGFPSNTMYSMEEDKVGRLWVSTNSGLVRFDPKTEEKRVFTTSDGLLSDQFNYKSSFKDASGKLYFGSIDGFVLFDPSSFKENVYQPSIVITDFLLFNKSVTASDAGSPLRESILFANEIELQSNQNVFSLQIALLTFQSSTKHTVVYRLEGLSDKWQELGANHVIHYSHLPYGRYTLHIKDANDAQSPPRTLTLRIHPPFYLSTKAYIVYVVMGISAVIALFLYQKKKYERKQQQAIGSIERQKERDLYISKIDFFTNITHEIRTPLTLIKGPLENILNESQLPGPIREDLKVMDLNTDRLLDLVNQLLDFRKTESLSAQLQLVMCNVTDVLRNLSERFKPLAQKRGIEYRIDHIEDIYSHVDVEALTKIMSNLLSNAVKYSESYIRISLRKADSNIALLICNDGDLVPLEMRQEIFKPFTRYKESHPYPMPGTGLGLPLSRSLAELHGGTIDMPEVVNENQFLLTLPIKSVFQKEDEETKEIFEEALWEDENLADNPHTVLVVEDNPEVLSFVARQLSTKYRVLAAENGSEAVEELKKHMIHIIISDIMMPKMDGLEFCDYVKSNVNFSHIPIILLTAKTTLQAKIHGLQSGADAYIEKPFSPILLQTSVENLLKTREHLQAVFTQSPYALINSMGVTEADRGFLDKLREITENNMEETDFDIDKMANGLNMSRSSLHRKMKGLLDMTPNDYIRLERLKKAAVLLKEGNYKINEVCYMVGFNTPSYFAKCFQKQFGVLPKDFVNAAYK